MFGQLILTASTFPLGRDAGAESDDFHALKII
jgi:hypothetical protein